NLGTIGAPQATDQERLVKDAAGGRGGGGEIEEMRRSSDAIDGEIVRAGMYGIGSERAEIGSNGFELERASARREAITQLVIERLAPGDIVDQGGDLRGFRRTHGQIEWNGCHESSLEQ